MKLFHRVKYTLPITLFLLIAGCQLLPVEQQSPSTPLPPSPNPVRVNPPIIQSFEIQPTEVLIGEPATLSWKVDGASKIEITPDIGIVANADTITLLPAERTIYQLHANNSGGSTSKTTIINVNRNFRAKPIALTIEEMESQGFKFDTNSEPSQKGTVSTYYIKFVIGLTGSPFIDNAVYIYRTIAEAENIFAEEKYNSRMFVAGFIPIGTQGYYMIIKTFPAPEPPTISMLFQKNNVYVKITSNLDYLQIENYARVCEERIK